MRARDQDRADACTTLDAGFADGQLTEQEHGQRVSAAMHAKSLRELHRLVADLQGESALTPLSGRATALRPRRRIAPAIVVAGLLVLVIAAFARSCDGTDTAAPTVSFGSGGYLTPPGLADVVTGLQREFGAATVDDLTVYPDYAVVFRPDPAAPRKQVSYRYDQRGFSAPSNSGTRSPDVAMIDLATVNVSTMAGLVAGAAQSLNLSAVDTVYLIIRATDDSQEVSVHASNELGEDGHLATDLAGNFTYVYPFDPDRK